jgi:FAD/FMN-containing dehydrogenase/Fe-S oxidoreductase
MSEAIDRSTTTLAVALRDVFKGEILSDAFTRSMYATDASIYEIEPVLVVYPLDELDVRSVMWFGARHGVPVIARGGGTGLAGESLGKAIIMDMNIHMNRIVELDKARKQVTVQTGVVLDSLNRALAQHGFRFTPDPASGNRCTIGGMIANNASGAHSLKYGDTSQNVIAARVCLMDGTVTLANPVKLSSAEYEQKKLEEGYSGKIHRELPGLVQKNTATIAAKKSKAERNRAGYALGNVVNGDIYDLTKLIAGSEGTLGIVTQAVLKVEPLPGRVAMAVVYFGSLLDAARAIPAIRQTEPVACELLDERLMALSREASGNLIKHLPENAKALLIVEYEGQDEAETTKALDNLKTKLPAGTFQNVVTVTEPREQLEIWAARDAATPMLFRRKDGLQPIPVVEDGAVPVEKLAAYIEKAGKIFEKYKLEWSAYAHAGHGEVHLRPMMDLRRKDHVDILEKLAGEVHAAVWECEGTISGEHAEGLVRTQFVEKQAGKELYAVYKEVKELFDPRRLLNPDKKISADAHLMLKNLRFGAKYHFSTDERPKHASIDPTQAANYRMFKSQLAIRTENTVEALAANPLEVHNHGVSPLNWSGREMAAETERCNGCGHCRTTGPDEDMCPRFKYERIEDASPRAKANVLRRMMTGRQGQGAFSSQELIEIMDTCFNCKLCEIDCPAGVNIPKIVLEAKARYHQAHGLRLDQYVMTKAESFMRLGSWISPLANTLSQTPVFRYLAEKTIGFDRRRPLPRLKRWNLRRRYTPSPVSNRQKVVLYLDLFARYNAPEIAQACVDVLEHNGFEVEIPDVPWTNAPALSNGAVMESRRQVDAVCKRLAQYAFAGIPILTPEPTAAMCLTQDFLSYVDTPESRAVARHTHDIAEFLMNLKQHKRLKLDFQKVETTFGYHQPCHHKSLKIGTPGMDLVRHVPGVTMLLIDEGCCGNPSGWGYSKRNYDESMWIGRNLFKALSASKNHVECGLTESSCCRGQMEHGSGKTTLHPIQILAQAYGYTQAAAVGEGLEKLDLPEKPQHHADEHIHIEAPKPSMMADAHSADTAQAADAHAHAADAHAHAGH